MAANQRRLPGSSQRRGAWALAWGLPSGLRPLAFTLTPVTADVKKETYADVFS
jgi:hypothetical protein